MHSRRSDGRVAAGCRAAVRTGGFSARERGGAREYAGPRVGYSRCGAARRSRHRRRDSWPTLSHVGDFFPDVAAARAGSRGGRLCCLRSPRRVVRRREASFYQRRAVRAKATSRLRSLVSYWPLGSFSIIAAASGVLAQLEQHLLGRNQLIETKVRTSSTPKEPALGDQGSHIINSEGTSSGRPRFAHHQLRRNQLIETKDPG